MIDMKDPEVLRNKHVLLDTNILIDSSKFPDEFGSFFDLLNEKSVISVIDQTIKFEFLRGAQNNAEYKKLEDFLDLLFGQNRLELEPNRATFDVARKIASLSYRTGNKSIKLGDSLIAAQVEKYSRNGSGNLFLATQNHKDFPPFLFNCVYVHLITLKDGSIKPVGIYEFNTYNFKKLS